MNRNGEFLFFPTTRNIKQRERERATMGTINQRVIVLFTENGERKRRKKKCDEHSSSDF